MEPAELPADLDGDKSSVGRALGVLVRVGTSETGSEPPHEPQKRLSEETADPQAGQWVTRRSLYGCLADEASGWIARAWPANLVQAWV